MSKIIEMNDLSSPALDVFARLTETQLRNRLEPEKGIFIAENPKVIRIALDRGCKPVSLLMEHKQLTGQARDIIDRCGEIPVYVASRELLEGLTGFQLTRGVLCAMNRPQLQTVEEICDNAHRVVILENISEATNVGAIFRSAAALHVDGVLVTPSCCDPLCRRGIGVSMGTVFQVPWTRMGNKPSDWPGEGIGRLKNMGFKTMAMALREDAIPIDAPQLAAEQKLAIVMGAEGNGLASCTIASCDYVARIPMSPKVDSLNVAAASAVAFWELRVRSFNRNHHNI